MEGATKFLMLFINVLVFLFAVSVFFMLSKNYYEILKTSKSIIEEQPVLRVEIYEEKEKQVTYGELIATLFQELEYNIQIDELLISKYEHDASRIESYSIRQNNYTYEYIYDASDNLSFVIYKSIKN